tara:strand:+ start:16826 stop:17197 length:372 start_codon:yes stop_codon:yes gene_type:complete
MTINYNATATHTFAVYNTADGDFTFVSIAAGDDYADVVHASCEADMYDGFMTIEWARALYVAARDSGTLLSTEAAQSVIDGDAKMVKLTQKGRSFHRAVKGSPFRYAQSCATRSGVKTGYDVC